MTFKKISLVPAFALAALVSPGAQAADNADATATASVTAALQITNTKDLEFGEGFTGDLAKVVAANAAEAASFDVQGEPLAAYTVQPISDITLDLVGGSGAANEQIAVTTFLTDGVENLSAGGVDTFTVGATRGALANDQVSGNYTGIFNVSIVY